LVRCELADLEEVEAERLDLGQHALQRRLVQTRHRRASVLAPSGSRAGVTGWVNRFRWLGGRQRRIPRDAE